MLQEADYLEIDRYLDGVMDTDELIAFELKVQENDEWRNALEKQQVKQLTHRRAFEKKMASRQQLPERRVDGLMPRMMISVAIGACIVAILLFISPWKKNVYLQFSSTEMPLPDNPTPLQRQTAHAFNRRQFEKALQLLDQQLAQQPTDTLSLLYKGISLMEQDHLDAAHALLEKIATGGHSTLQYEAAFYNALAYERAHNRAAAMTWLGKIPEDAANYPLAQQMMREIK